MWDIWFWVLFALVLLASAVVIAIKKIRFIDVQLIIMIAALSLACDMIFCKQLELYNYVNLEYRGWYSFWANLFIVPAWGFLFIKSVPKSNKGAVFHIIAWTIASTLFEHFVVKPLGIVQYHRWEIIVYSTIGYFLVLTWIYVYYKLMQRYTKKI